RGLGDAGERVEAALEAAAQPLQRRLVVGRPPVLPGFEAFAGERDQRRDPLALVAAVPDAGPGAVLDAQRGVGRGDPVAGTARQLLIGDRHLPPPARTKRATASARL